MISRMGGVRWLGLSCCLISIAFAPLQGAESKGGAAAGAAGPRNSSRDLQAPIIGFVAQPAPSFRRAIGRSSASQIRPTLNVRPVMGLPGAAALGSALSLPGDLTSVEISPTQTYLIAERGANDPPALLSLGSAGAGPELTISGAFSRSDRVEFSLSGSAAALYSVSMQRIQVITGLPGAPQVSQQFDVSSFPAPLVSLAVSDDGTALLAGVFDLNTRGIYFISAGNGIRRVASAKFPAAVRFVSQADSAVVADSEANQVLLLSDLTGAVTSSVLAGAADGARTPNQIEVIAGGKAALVSNEGSDGLIWIDLTNSKLTPVSFRFRVEGLQAVAGAPLVFISSEPASLWLVNQTTGGPSVTYVPASVGSGSLP